MIFSKWFVKHGRNKLWGFENDNFLGRLAYAMEGRGNFWFLYCVQMLDIAERVSNVLLKYN